MENNEYELLNKIFNKPIEIKLKNNKYINNQLEFVKRQQIVLNLLKFYFTKIKCPIKNKFRSDFNLYFSDEIVNHYKIDLIKDCPEYIHEFLMEFADDINRSINNKDLYITINGNGIFSYFDFTKNKRKKLSLDKALEFSDFSDYQGI